MHEVILDVRFNSRLDEDALATLPALVAGENWSSSERVKGAVIKAEFGTTGSVLQTEALVAGWEFSQHDPRRVLRANPAQFTYHVARPGEWPVGEYPGWESVFAGYSKIFNWLAPAYSKGAVQRAGLRYLNRIAIPRGQPIRDFLRVGMVGPDILDDVYSFNLSQTWATVAGTKLPGISATIRLSTINILDPSVGQDQFGLLLDIDIFNLRVNDAPVVGDVLEWMTAAHDAEGSVFDACITPALRSTFEEVSS